MWSTRIRVATFHLFMVVLTLFIASVGARPPVDMSEVEGPYLELPLLPTLTPLSCVRFSVVAAGSHSVSFFHTPTAQHCIGTLDFEGDESTLKCGQGNTLYIRFDIEPSNVRKVYISHIPGVKPPLNPTPDDPVTILTYMQCPKTELSFLGKQTLAGTGLSVTRSMYLDAYASSSLRTDAVFTPITSKAQMDAIKPGSDGPFPLSQVAAKTVVPELGVVSITKFEGDNEDLIETFIYETHNSTDPSLFGLMHGFRLRPSSGTVTPFLFQFAPDGALTLVYHAPEAVNPPPLSFDRSRTDLVFEDAYTPTSIPAGLYSYGRRRLDFVNTPAASTFTREIVSTSPPKWRYVYDTPTGQRMVCTETMTDVLRSRGRQTCTSTDGATATSITRTFTQKRNADGSYTLYVSSTPINPDQPVANDVYPSRLLPVLSPSNIRYYVFPQSTVRRLAGVYTSGSFGMSTCVGHELVASDVVTFYDRKHGPTRLKVQANGHQGILTREREGMSYLFTAKFSAGGTAENERLALYVNNCDVNTCTSFPEPTDPPASHVTVTKYRTCHGNYFDYALGGFLDESGSAVSMEVSVSEGTRVRRGDAGEYLLERIDKKRDILTQFVGPTTHGPYTISPPIIIDILDDGRQLLATLHSDSRYAAEQGSPHRILTPESRPQIPLEGEWMHMDVMECVSHHRTSALSASVSTEYDPSLPPKKCSIHMLKWAAAGVYHCEYPSTSTTPARVTTRPFFLRHERPSNLLFLVLGPNDSTFGFTFDDVALGVTHMSITPCDRSDAALIPEASVTGYFYTPLTVTGHQTNLHTFVYDWGKHVVPRYNYQADQAASLAKLSSATSSSPSTTSSLSSISPITMTSLSSLSSTASSATCGPWTLYRSFVGESVASLASTGDLYTFTSWGGGNVNKLYPAYFYTATSSGMIVMHSDVGAVTTAAEVGDTTTLVLRRCLKEGILASTGQRLLRKYDSLRARAYITTVRVQAVDEDSIYIREWDQVKGMEGRVLYYVHLNSSGYARIDEYYYNTTTNTNTEPTGIESHDGVWLVDHLHEYTFGFIPKGSATVSSLGGTEGPLSSTIHLSHIPLDANRLSNILAGKWVEAHPTTEGLDINGKPAVVGSCRPMTIKRLNQGSSTLKGEGEGVTSGKEAEGKVEGESQGGSGTWLKSPTPGTRDACAGIEKLVHTQSLSSSTPSSSPSSPSTGSSASPAPALIARCYFDGEDNQVADIFYEGTRHGKRVVIYAKKDNDNDKVKEATQTMWYNFLYTHSDRTGAFLMVLNTVDDDMDASYPSGFVAHEAKLVTPRTYFVKYTPCRPHIKAAVRVTVPPQSIQTTKTPTTTTVTTPNVASSSPSSSSSSSPSISLSSPLLVEHATFRAISTILNIDEQMIHHRRIQPVSSSSTTPPTTFDISFGVHVPLDGNTDAYQSTLIRGIHSADSAIWSNLLVDASVSSVSVDTSLVPFEIPYTPTPAWVLPISLLLSILFIVVFTYIVCYRARREGPNPVVKPKSSKTSSSSSKSSGKHEEALVLSESISSVDFSRPAPLLQKATPSISTLASPVRELLSSGTKVTSIESPGTPPPSNTKTKSSGSNNKKDNTPDDHVDNGNISQHEYVTLQDEESR